MDLSALFKLTYGLFVLGVEEGGVANGCVINTAIQVTAEPPRLTAVVNRENLTCEMIEKKGSFAVSALSCDTDLKTIGLFGFKSGRDVNKFESCPYACDSLGNPYLTENTISRYACRVVGKMDAGTHILFVGELVEAEVIGEGEPMTYSYYRDVKRGGTSRLAPSYLKPTAK